MSKVRARSSYGLNEECDTWEEAVARLTTEYALAKRHVQVVKDGGRVRRGNLEVWCETGREVHFREEGIEAPVYVPEPGRNVTIAYFRDAFTRMYTEPVNMNWDEMEDWLTGGIEERM